MPSQAAADGVAAQGQRKSGLLAPPLAQIEHTVKTVGGIGELALVDDEPGVEVARQYFRNDFVKGNRDCFDSGTKQLESEVSGGQRTGNRDLARGESDRA